MARIPRANHATSPTFIFQRKEFTCNSMRGRWIERWQTDTGDLNDEEVEAFNNHFLTGEPMFVVYSYATPIAFWTEAHGWHKVDQKFSVTTSKHQSRLYLI